MQSMETKTSKESLKRKRPSYLANFPPLDEFNDSSGGGIQKGVDANPSKVVRLKVPPGAIEKNNTERMGRHTVSNQTGRSKKNPDATVQPSFGRTVAGIRQIQNRIPSHTSLPEMIQSSGSKRTCVQGQRQSVVDVEERSRRVPDNVVAVSSTKNGRPRISRCKRCIENRKGCDGLRPACSNCARVGKECEYDEARISRSSYLQGMNRQAEMMRKRMSSQALKEHDNIQDLQRHKPRVGEWERTVNKSTSADHLGFLGHLKHGSTPPDDGIFDETSRMLEKFQRQEGSVVDEWAREKYAGLELNWESFKYQHGQVVHVPHGAATGTGELSNLKQRIDMSSGSR